MIRADARDPENAGRALWPRYYCDIPKKIKGPTTTMI
jgi:hypothetical protein